MKKALTHAGKFHADDVFSSALLKIIYPEIEIERVFQVPENYDGIVFDIGFGEYDHHQEDKRVRENGIPYAAFGLLWEKYGIQLVGEKKAKEFDASFVQPLDESDNTGCRNEMASMIGIFNPGWNESLEVNACFERAVQIAKLILERKIAHMLGEEEADEIVEEAMNGIKDHILRLEQFVPWKKKVIGSDAWFVVYPSNRGGYNAQGVPITDQDQALVCPFPEAWRAKGVEELQAISQIKTARFCHASGFLFAADDLEDAMNACELAIQEKSMQEQQE